MNKQEQQFSTKLGAWLKKTKFPKSMLIEVKVARSKNFRINTIRKGQHATLRRVLFGLPVAHKISDKGSGNKLVDMIYISPNNTPLVPSVAVKIGERAYLFPYALIESGEKTSYSAEDLHDHLISW